MDVFTIWQHQYASALKNAIFYIHLLFQKFYYTSALAKLCCRKVKMPNCNPTVKNISIKQKLLVKNENVC